MSMTIRRWAVPAFSVAIGAVMFAVGVVADQLGLGLAMFGIMLGYAVVLVVFRRSEPIALLSEESTDERRRLIQLKAGYFSLNVVVALVLGGFLVDLLRGGDGGPWALIAAVGAVSFVAALIFHSRRG